MPLKCQLDLDLNGKEVDQREYRYMIGSLVYLCESRPDIMLNVGTGDQLADIFTKPLDEARFRELRHELNIIDSSNVV